MYETFRRAAQLRKTDSRTGQIASLGLASDLASLTSSVYGDSGLRTEHN